MFLLNLFSHTQGFNEYVQQATEICDGKCLRAFFNISFSIRKTFSSVNVKYF